MLSRLRGLFRITEDDKTRTKEAKEKTANNLCLLSGNEGMVAKEAKERTQRLLADALKKKESLLVEDPKVFADLKLEKLYPFITTDLVEDLIRETEKVTFAKNTDPTQDIKAIAYVYPGSEDRTIYLCAAFWKKDPESKSQQDTIIHEVSHFLGYHHTVQENSDRVQTSPQSMLCPQTAYSVASALTSSMDHRGTYTDGSYSCCGETSWDTVCEKSGVGAHIRLVKLMHKVERLWKQTLPGQRFTAGEETDTAREELGSDNCSVKKEFSFEDTDTSDDEIEGSEELTDIVMQMVKRWTTLVKMVTTQTDLFRTQTDLLEKQKILMKQINLLKMQTNLLEAQDNVLKVKVKTEKTLDDMEKTLANMLESLGDMWDTQTKMFVTLVHMAKTKADVMKTLCDVLKTLADVLETQYISKRRMVQY